MSKSILLAVLSTLLLIMGCGGSPASTPVVIEKEVIIEVEKEVIKTVIVVATPIPTMLPVSVTGPYGELIAAADDMINMGTDLMVYMPSPQGTIYLEELYDYLFEKDFDGKFIPSLATDWEMSSDQLTWTFDIRKGVEFHDGSPLTAEDVAYSWNRSFFDPESTATTAIDYAQNVESITAEGNKLVVVTKEPQANVDMWGNYPNLGAGGMILSKKQLEEQGADAYRNNPIGTGPYRFKERIVNQYIKLTASDQEHWFKEPGFKDLTILEIPELSTRIALLKTGGADLVGASIASRETILESGLQAVSAPATGVSALYYLYLYADGHPFNDQRVREAISIAIDRKTIGERLYLGEAWPLSNMPAAPGTFGYNDDVKPHPYDLERAKQLMKDAGYADGFEVQIWTYINDADFPNLPTLGEAALGYLEDINITGDVKIYDWTTLGGTILVESAWNKNPTPEETPYPLFIRGNDARFYSLRWMRALLHSENSRKPLFGNGIPWLDETINKAFAEFDTAKEEELIREANRRLTDEYWHAPLLYANTVFGLSNRIAGWTPTTGRSWIHNFWTARPAEGVK